MEALALLFWTAVGIIVMTYGILPALVIARGALAPRAVARASVTPHLTIIVAAHNEAASIGRKLASLLATDYPAELREVIVVSDGSTDATEDVVRDVADGVRLIALPRVGKATALNTAIAEAGGEILVFTDANNLLAPTALRALVAPFADASVGAVAGDQRYGGHAGAELADAERRYWDLDRVVKRAESAAGSVISATGALYAIRRGLVSAVPDGVTDDFYQSTGVVAQGLRLVFAEDAIAYEDTADSGHAEFARKVRVMTRGLRAVQLRRALLNPRRFGFYSVQLLWHKVLRRLVAVPLLVVGLTAPWLWSSGEIYQLAVLSQAAFYSAALIGLKPPVRHGRLAAVLRLPTYFCLVNAAALYALANIVRGRRIDRWETARSGSGPAVPA